MGVILAALAGWTLKLDPPAPEPVTRFVDEAGLAQQPLFSPAAVSPDGRYLAYTGEDGLYLRTMDQLGARRIHSIATLVEAVTPFFSPDSQWVVFFNRSGKRFEKVSSP